MGKHSIRLPEYQSEGLRQFKRETGMNMSDIIRSALSEFISSWECNGDELPEWVQKEASHDRIVRENKPQMRAMHFKQNVYGYLLHECLEGEDMQLARFPPHPDKVRENYADSVREQIEQEHEQYADEYLGHLERMMEWYELVHPDTGREGRKGIIQFAAYLMRWEDEGRARMFVDLAMEENDVSTNVSKHDLLDEARQIKAKKTWKMEWDDCLW